MSSTGWRFSKRTVFSSQNADSLTMHVDFWQAEQQSTIIVLFRKVSVNCLAGLIVLVSLWKVMKPARIFLVSANSHQVFLGAYSQPEHYYFSLFPNKNNVEFHFGSLEKMILIRNDFFLYLCASKKKKMALIKKYLLEAFAIGLSMSEPTSLYAMPFERDIIYNIAVCWYPCSGISLS